MEDKLISLNESIYSLAKKYPEIKKLMLKLGFDNITDKTMLNSVGRFMTLSKGSKLKRIDIDTIKNEFTKHGFTFKEENHNEK